MAGKHQGPFPPAARGGDRGTKMSLPGEAQEDQMAARFYFKKGFRIEEQFLQPL